MKTDSEFDADIAIVGGGMVGATLALMLAAARRDWRIALVETSTLPSRPESGRERQPIYQPSFDARSTAIAAGSAEIFADLGVWDRLARHATAIRRVHVSDKGHFGASLIDCDTYGLPALGYVVENGWMGSVLLHCLQSQSNLSCLAPATVRRLLPRRRGAELTLVRRADEQGASADKSAPGEKLLCQVAIVADGAASPLRESLGIDASVTDYRQTAVTANLAFDEPHREIAYERFTRTGPLALLPLGGSPESRRSALVWTLPQERVEAAMALSDRAFLEHLQRGFGHRLGRFVQVGRRQQYPLQLVIAREQVRSALVMMGNAAHFLHPVAGQGFNLALRDCAALVEALGRAADTGGFLGDLRGLQSYVESQRLDQMLTIGFSDTLVRLFSSARTSAVGLRTLGFIGLDSVAPAKRFLAKQSMGRVGRRARLASCVGGG